MTISFKCAGVGVSLEFQRVELHFETAVYSNVFACKTNKTLAQTIQHKRYKNLAAYAENYTHRDLFLPIGTFLLQLKNSGDPFYKEFLNNCGDLEYCRFCITAKEWLQKKGLYMYVIKGKIMYIGRCRDSFKKRINNGYGHISPKNCYKDGQKTNCHLNNLILQNKSCVQLFAHEIDDDTKIRKWEQCMIKEFKPEWNIALCE